MNTTINTSAELIRQLGYIADDENYMKKALRYIKKLAAQKEQEVHSFAEDAEEYRPRTKAEMVAGFNQACQEVKLYKEGKLQLKTWEEIYHEL